jgi:hypothetical protein
MNTREYNRRVKRAVAELKAQGAAHVAVDIWPDGRTRVLEVAEDQADDEAARVGRLIEERMGNA